ncbi:hypothetical protein BDZ45DRAFT_267942 [Acephala macrosclerotiorum]|nr:hypothetical protein BDZ45DRAFT_267942 [Acephala macrosclerotiorum]
MKYTKMASLQTDPMDDESVFYPNHGNFHRIPFGMIRRTTGPENHINVAIRRTILYTNIIIPSLGTMTSKQNGDVLLDSTWRCAIPLLIWTRRHSACETIRLSDQTGTSTMECDQPPLFAPSKDHLWLIQGTSMSCWTVHLKVATSIVGLGDTF